MYYLAPQQYQFIMIFSKKETTQKDDKLAIEIEFDIENDNIPYMYTIKFILSS